MIDSLRRLQLTQLQILEEVDRVCRRHDLRYCLNGGTLLGALRHKGFIPWDDDLDIIMPRRDYEAFLQIAPQALDPAYFLDDASTNRDYYLPFAKVRKAGTLFEDAAIAHTTQRQEIFIDVFPHDNAANGGSFWQSLRFRLSRKFGKTMYARHGIVFNGRKLNPLFRILFLLPNRLNYRVCRYLATRCADEQSGYVLSTFSQHGIRRQLMPRSRYYPCSEVEFEGRRYPAPFDPDYVLTRIYGDYMRLPPAEQRVPMHRGMRVLFGDEPH